MSLVTTSGDAGDAVFCLSILQALPGGPHDLLIEEKDEYTASGRTTEGPAILCNFIKDLVITQPYMQDCRLLQSTDRPFWRSGGFRKAGMHQRNEPLLNAHLNHLNRVTPANLKVDTSKKWLWVNPSPETKGRVVINRTARYRNASFPWDDIVSYYGNRILFLGMPHEHAEFVASYGSVEFRPTKLLIEIAQLISGSELFIGNQSCCNAVAEGLKHNSIQETSTRIPDCIFKRPNAQHVWDGNCDLPSMDSRSPLQIRGKGLSTGLVSTMFTPPMGWKFPGLAPQETYQQCEDQAAQLTEWYGKSRAEIMEAIKRHNLNLYPEHYRPNREGAVVKEALQFAERQVAN